MGDCVILICTEFHVGGTTVKVTFKQLPVKFVKRNHRYLVAVYNYSCTIYNTLFPHKYICKVNYFEVKFENYLLSWYVK